MSFDAGPLLGRRTVRWASIAAALNLVWEIAHLPLYTIYRDETVLAIAYAVAHCTVGDALIAAAGYLAAAAVTGQADWPVAAPAPGGIVATLAGLSYTVFSEWLNVVVLESWAYTESMPRIYGIGLSPLLQWIVLPGLVLALVRGLDRKGRARIDPHQTARR